MNGDSRPGAPLSLAVGGPRELRRGAACRDRRARTRARSSTSPTVAPQRSRARPARAAARSRARPASCARSAALRGQGRRAGRRRAPLLPHLVMPAHHDVRPKDVMLRRLHGALAAAAERGPDGFRRAAAGAGRRRAHRARRWRWSPRWCTARRCRFADPARFSLAHGGKDRHPYPGADQGLRRDDRRAEVGGRAAPSSATTRSSTRSAGSTARRAGSSAHATGPSFGAFIAGGAAALARVWRAQRLRLGAAACAEGENRHEPGNSC